MLAGKYMVPVKVEYTEDRIFLDFPYNPALKDDIKALEGSRWHGNDEKNPRKAWSITRSPHNQFQLLYLAGKNPYAPFDAPLLEVMTTRSLRKHQVEMVAHGLTRKRAILAAEMGTGKSLCAIEVMEQAGFEDWWYVGPSSAIRSFEYELKKWNSKVIPMMMTYEKLTKVIEQWSIGKIPPKGIIIDESSRVKNPTTKRSEAVQHLTDAMRKEHNQNCYIIEMSGSPSPKSPADWFSQCRIAQPGFLKEGTLSKFKERLAVLSKQESLAGTTFNQLVTWLDDERKCATCGMFADHFNHEEINAEGHLFVASVNRVTELYERMKGLVLVIFKKDVLDLPEKIYKEIILEPTASMVRAASIIESNSSSAIQALTLLRELSDGFRYTDKIEGKETCATCEGTKTQNRWVSSDDSEDIMLAPGDEGYLERVNDGTYKLLKLPCLNCDGTGEQNRIVRDVTYVTSPKEAALIEILEEHEDVGRLVIFASFTAAIDKCVEVCRKQQWHVIRVDARGWTVFDPDGNILDQFKNREQELFQDMIKEFDRVAFIAHPFSGGMGLTLTKSPSILYFDNDFNAENRIQSEDRIHRIGMDINRGATIIDLIHLPADRLVLDNLKKKRDLQALSLGDFRVLIQRTERKV
jgi:SNF2 family DNA or RNA helicase